MRYRKIKKVASIIKERAKIIALNLYSDYDSTNHEINEKVKEPIDSCSAKDLVRKLLTRLLHSMKYVGGEGIGVRLKDCMHAIYSMSKSKDLREHLMSKHILKLYLT